MCVCIYLFTSLYICTYVRKVFDHPAKMAAKSGELPALDILNSMIMLVYSVLSPYLMVKKYSSFPQL